MKKPAAILVLVFILFGTGRANAQSGSCPPNSYLLGNVDGSYPANVSACSYDLSRVHVDPNLGTWPPHLPDDEKTICDQFVHADGDISEGSYLSIERDLSVVFVPDASQYYGPLMNFKAVIWGSTLFPTKGLTPPGIILDDAIINITHFDHNENILAITWHYFSDLAYIDTYYEDFATHYYRVYLINEFFNAGIGCCGYIRINVNFPEDISDVNIYDWNISAVRIGSNLDYLPDHCPIPNAIIPATPTPPGPTATLPATWTPDPSITPTATPTAVTTPGPTAAGGTPPIQWTLTPYSFSTVAAENTPTPWPPYSIATIDWPTIEPQLTIMPGAVATLDIIGDDVLSITNFIDTEWQTNLSFSESALEDSADNTGIEAPSNIIADFISLMGIPISYAKLVGDYLPNTAPYVAFILIAAAWIPFNMIARLSLSMAARLFELVRRILELIPGM